MKEAPAQKTWGGLGVYLSPLKSVLWVIFALWSAVAVVVLAFDVGAGQVRGWTGNPGLQAALVHLVASFEPIWIVLSAVLLYLQTVGIEGIATARKWALTILIGSALLWWCGAATGIPCGPIHYTNNLGSQIAGVLPFTIPLLWLVIVISSRFLVLRFFPKATRWQLALGVAVLALLTDINLEPIAWKVRAYWLWYAADPAPPLQPPVQNYLTWFAAAFLLTMLLREKRVARAEVPRRLQPHLLVLTLNGVLLAVHLIRWVV